MALYRNRTEAGEKLAAALDYLRRAPGLLVLALPRGGVPVAAPVARRLGAPLDVFVVRKIGYPGHEEFAVGAVASGGAIVLDPELVEALPEPLFRDALEQALRELEEQEQRYRGGRPPPRVEGRTIVLVDDGLATGSTMRAAIEALHRQHPRQIHVAVPVASPETCEALAREVDGIVCAATPEPFYAVGAWYDDFSPTTDEEVRRLLQSAGPTQEAGAEAAP